MVSVCVCWDKDKERPGVCSFSAQKWCKIATMWWNGEWQLLFPWGMLQTTYYNVFTLEVFFAILCSFYVPELSWTAVREVISCMTFHHKRTFSWNQTLILFINLFFMTHFHESGWICGRKGYLWLTQKRDSTWTIYFHQKFKYSKCIKIKGYQMGLVWRAVHTPIYTYWTND